MGARRDFVVKGVCLLCTCRVGLFFIVYSIVQLLSVLDCYFGLMQVLNVDDLWDCWLLVWDCRHVC